MRPAQCPVCRCASRPAGQRLAVVGHGLRSLDMLGPATSDGAGEEIEVVGRRYRCRGCSAVCLVTPGGVRAGRRYLWPSVTLALALWSVRELSELAVRGRISPYAIVGPSVTGWATLRRWARAYGVGDGSLRDQARRYVLQVLGRSPLSAQKFAIEARIYSASLHPG